VKRSSAAKLKIRSDRRLGNLVLRNPIPVQEFSHFLPVDTNQGIQPIMLGVTFLASDF